MASAAALVPLVARKDARESWGKEVTGPTGFGLWHGGADVLINSNNRWEALLASGVVSGEWGGGTRLRSCVELWQHSGIQLSTCIHRAVSDSSHGGQHAPCVLRYYLQTGRGSWDKKSWGRTQVMGTMQLGSRLYRTSPISYDVVG